MAAHKQQQQVDDNKMVVAGLCMKLLASRPQRVTRVLQSLMQGLLCRLCGEPVWPSHIAAGKLCGACMCVDVCVCV